MNIMVQLFWQSNIFGKLVLLVLIASSIAALGIGIFLIAFYRSRLVHIKKAQALLDKSTHFDSLLSLAGEMHSTEPGLLLARLLTQLKYVLQKNERKQLLESDKEFLYVISEQGMYEYNYFSELLLRALTAIAEIAPLMGLFGTVGGLINAFAQIGLSKNADISAVAPGIAEALITTLAGLLATMVALVAFHVCFHKARLVEHHIQMFHDKIMYLISTSFE